MSSITLQRLIGFSSASVLSDVTTWDADTNATLVTNYVDRMSKQLTQVTHTPQSTLNATNITVNGLLISILGKASRIEKMAGTIFKWVGKGARTIKNKFGDTVFISANGKRRVRFDLNNPSPHINPHSHAEELVNGKWVKSGPIYPIDVLPF